MCSKIYLRKWSKASTCNNGHPSGVEVRWLCTFFPHILRLMLPDIWKNKFKRHSKLNKNKLNIYQFSSVTQSCPTICDPMNCSTPGLPVHHQLPEFTQTHVHQLGDAIQPSHPLLSPSPPAPNPSWHQGLFQWVNPSHEVAKVLEFQLQHKSFHWAPRTDLL